MNLLRRILVGTVGVVCLTTPLSGHAAPPKQSLNIPPHGPSFKGKRAQNVVLRDLSGKPVSLKDYAGKPVILNVWATWCPPCLQEMPLFEKFRQSYSTSGLTVLGLSIDIYTDSASENKIAEVAKHAAATYPVLMANKSVVSAYGSIHQLPETFYINSKGIVVEGVWGHADEASILKKHKRDSRTVAADGRSRSLYWLRSETTT